MGMNAELDAIEGMRPELTGFCYRMMGSIFEAEDAVQETMLRVWQKGDQLRDAGTSRAWVYRIARNVCLDRLRSAKRRALPMDLSGAAAIVAEPVEQLPGTSWIWPAPDTSANPADIVVGKETLRLSFLALLQTLPPRQRAVLILHDVFRLSAHETADALEMTVAAVNSAVQRARATIGRSQSKLRSAESLRAEAAGADTVLIDRYMAAFERFDIEAMLELFHENASLSMPPFTMWVCGRADLASFYEATRWHCTGSRMIRTSANGCPALAQYFPSGEEGVLSAWCIQVLEFREGKIEHVHHFIDTELFRRFGLPVKLYAGKDF